MLPEGVTANVRNGQPEATYDTRDGLTPPAWHVANVTNGGKGELRLSPAPQGLSGVERVLWPSLGLACARAAFFLYEWQRTRRYMPSCDKSGAQPHEIAQFRICSPVFSALFDAVTASVRESRILRTEDTLDALANGEMRKIKRVVDPDGAETVTDEGAVYDMKAAALLLPAIDPARYGGKGAGAGGVAVSIVLQCPPCDAPPVVDVSATSAQVPEDVDYVEA